MEAEGIRLNKFLSEAGVCSRREADRLIEFGKVRINGQAVTAGQKVLPGQSVSVKGREIITTGKKEGHKEKQVLLAVYKPKGIVCTTSNKDRAPNIVDMLDYPVRVYPVGRLDKESEGLILMTNQGDLVNKIMRSGNAHEKEYLVKVNRPVTDEFIRKMKKGVHLTELDVTTKPCFVAKTGEKAFRIILTQGLNRQIRRMCEELNFEVRLLKRMRIMNIELGDLKSGAYRELSKKEYHQMKEAVKDSTSLSNKDQKKELSDGRRKK
ncbi:pseudouridine synthase [Lacrimispora algidixylanolytica]|uniref:Pseudouridine synthase n=1 Tax=Lacrimispora algidixylanolytica TaxID=94868 RepID=A0A419T2U4_9FIRM|nr:pseudouridine synthase [Lacrimispora algidixylanolytica]RKD31756.1 23S rRNA pseudouridine synthase F [Lacrimispora algidixylanolytica]